MYLYRSWLLSTPRRQIQQLWGFGHPPPPPLPPPRVHAPTACPEPWQELPGAEASGSRGRITIYCVAETLNRDLLTKKLRERGPQFLLHSYTDVLYGRYCMCAYPHPLLPPTHTTPTTPVLARAPAWDTMGFRIFA